MAYLYKRGRGGERPASPTRASRVYMRQGAGTGGRGARRGGRARGWRGSALPFLFPPAAFLWSPPATPSDTLSSFLLFSSETFSSIPDGCLNCCIHLLACFTRAIIYLHEHTRFLFCRKFHGVFPWPGSSFLHLASLLNFG